MKKQKYTKFSYTLRGLQNRKREIFSLFLLLFFIACSKKNQVIATYEIPPSLTSQSNKVKKVTYEELLWLLQLQNRDVKKIPSDVQQKILKSYLLSEITSYNIDQKKIENTKEYKNISALWEEKAKLSNYELYLQNKGISPTFKFIELQLVVLDGKDKQKSEEESKELLKKLNSPKISDEEIEEEIYQVSQHPRYKLQGGYIDPICISCSANPLKVYMEKINQAPPKKFIKINADKSVWLIRVIGKYTIEASDIQSKLEKYYRKVTRIAQKYFPKVASNDPKKSQLSSLLLSQEKIESLSKQKSDWLSNREKQNFLYSIVNQEKEKGNFQLKETAKLSNNLKNKKLAPNTVLYTFQKKDYNYAQLQKDLASVEEKEDLGKELRILHSLLIPLKVISHTEDFKKSLKMKSYSFLRDYIKRNVRVSAYYQIEKKKYKPDPKEVQRIYATEKNTRYKSVPYPQVIKQIQTNLVNRDFAEIQNKRREELAKQFKLTIKNEIIKENAL